MAMGSFDSSGSGQPMAEINTTPVADLDALAARLAEAARSPTKPDLHLRADSQTRYELLAKVMAAAQGAGMSSMAFVTDPRANAAAENPAR